MPLNYNFINNVDPLVIAEIERREGLYWPAGHINNEALAWNYQKTAYLTMTALLADKKTPKNKTSVVTDSEYYSGKPVGWLRVDYVKPETAGTPATYSTISTMVNPSKPILDLYNDKGTIKGAVINSAEISSDGTYGSILRTTVNFTVFDRFELDRYIDNFLRPGRDIELEYGWTVNDNIKQNQGKIRGTVYNFNFSAKSDGSWDCTLHALGPSSMTYGFGLDQQGTEPAAPDWIYSPKGKSLSEVFKTIIDTASTSHATDTDALHKLSENCIQRSISDSYQILNSKNAAADTTYPEFTNIYTFTFKLPVNKSLGPIGQIANIGGYIHELVNPVLPKDKANRAQESKEARDRVKQFLANTDLIDHTYITLRNLIKLINTILINSVGIPVPQYTFKGFNDNGSISTTEICKASLIAQFKKTGPTNFEKFAFITQVNGDGKDIKTKLDFNIGSLFTTAIINTSDSTVLLADLVMINVSYLWTAIQNILSNDTNLTGKKIISFLSNIFKELNTCTGGWISLIVTDSPKDPISHKSEFIQILNENYMPPKEAINIKSLEFKAFTKGSVVRNLSVEASVPDAIQAEVATYTRAGDSYVGSGDSPAEHEKTAIELYNALVTLNETFMDNINVDESQMQSSLSRWQNEIQGIYRKMFASSQGQTLAGNKISKYNIGDLGTAIFPIKLKVTLDGIEGFQYGNSVTSNWLPEQYMKDYVYWTVIKIRHMIQNNDWSTELDTIYRINT